MMNMKIGHKIAFLYSALTLCAVGLVSSVLYYWISDYTENLYYSFLEERAYLIGEQNTGKGGVQKSYNDYLQHKKNELHGPVASQMVLDADSVRTTGRVLKHLMTPTQIEELYNHKEIAFKHADSLGVALYFPKAEGNFIVIVLSSQHFGDYMHRQLGYWLMGIIALCVLMIFLVSKLYALHRINALDEAYQREKQFIHHASHELNNPLTAIQGECEIALMKPRSQQEYEDSLTRVSTESRRMVQIIRQLIYLSSAMDDIKTNGIEHILLRDFLLPFGSERIRLTITPANNPTTVDANPFLLKMALDNVLSNALKYSADEVSLRLDGCELRIVDHGIGIPGDELKYIFQPFYRASNTRAYKGNGIGFSLAARILNVYNIHVKIDSEIGKGTVVILDFSRATTLKENA